MSSSDPFSESFDSISIERAPVSAESIGASLEAFRAEIAAAPDTPGFSLLDDANGRFTIDRDTGVVSLAHEHLMAIEAGAIHPVRIKAVEPSGETYELRLRLRMTGRIPQIAGAEENDPLSLLGAPSSETGASLDPATACVWTEFAAFRATRCVVQRLWGEFAPFGTLLDPPPLAANITEPGVLSVAASPRPSPVDAIWDVR